MHSKISLGSSSSLRTKCRFLDLNVCLFVCFPYYSWYRKAKTLEHTDEFTGAGKT